MKRLSLLFCAVVLSVSALMAQRTVTGTVMDQLGEPLIGANILAQGTTAGTITDIDGTFSLDVPEGVNALVVSFTGYETQEVDITGASNVDITLAEGELLDEVVVTGLGIKKEKKALGYGVSTLASGAVANKGEVDVARILNGKATGVQISQTSGLAGSGTNIIIRGYSSISGSNQPLFVIDGVPFNTDTNTDRGNFAQGSATASSRFLDLDPNNIEEISILKGLSATVLYGEAGRNGVILVTTKTGSGSVDANKGLEVSVSQGYSVSQIANLPDYQNVYGNGFSGNYGAFFSNWGPAFDVRGSNGVAEDGTIQHPYDNGRNNSRLPEFIGQRYDYQAYESAENFFQDGTGLTTSISAKKNYENSSISVAYSYLDDEGFTPRRGEVVQTIPGDITSYEYMPTGEKSNAYTKHNLSLGASTKLSNGLSVNGSFNYITSNRVNPPAASGGFLTTTQNGISLFSDVLYTPRSVDLLHLPYEAADGSMVYYRGGSPIQNPLWTLNNTREEEDIDRFFGNVQLSYDITDFLTAQFRGGMDRYTQYNQFQANKGGSQQFAQDGVYSTSTRLNAIYDHVFNLL
ncbi:MAG: carboxypeptidase-like regulatory domain-containing protein, partial [Bacteroidota bacterium]